MYRLVVRLMLVGLGPAILAASLLAQGAPPPLVTPQELLDGLKPDGAHWLRG